jgi:hypothetical protein
MGARQAISRGEQTNQPSAYIEMMTPMVAGLTAIIGGTAISIGTNPALVRADEGWSGVAVWEDNSGLAMQ